MTVFSTITWNGVMTMTGTGTTVIASGGTLDITNTGTLRGGRTLRNEGTVNWNSGWLISGASGESATIENLGTWNITMSGGAVDDLYDRGGAGSRVFRNTGTVNRTTNTGSTRKVIKGTGYFLDY